MSVLPWRVVGSAGNCGRAATLADATKLAPPRGMAMVICDTGERHVRIDGVWSRISDYRGPQVSHPGKWRALVSAIWRNTTAKPDDGSRRIAAVTVAVLPSPEGPANDARPELESGFQRRCA